MTAGWPVTSASGRNDISSPDKSASGGRSEKSKARHPSDRGGGWALLKLMQIVENINVSKKRPVGRPPLNRNWDGPQAQRAERRRFPRSAVLIFRRMLRLAADCTCQDHSCTACRQSWVEHRNLHRELELPPWCYPAVERPGTPCPFPPSSSMAKTWEPDVEAQARWGRLFQATR